MADKVAHDLLVPDINEIVYMIPHQTQLQHCHIVFFCRYGKDCIEHQKVFNVIEDIEAVYCALVDVLRLTGIEFSFLASHNFQILVA